MADTELLAAFVSFGVEGVQTVDDEIDRIESRLEGLTDDNISLAITPELDDSAFGQATGSAGVLANAIENVDNELKKIDDTEIRRLASGFSDAAIGIDGIDETTTQMDGLNNSASRVNNVLFDTVNLAQDLPYGFRAVANNIPQVARSVQLLAADAGSASAALSQVTTSITGTIASIPGLTAALGVIGGGGVVAGLAASVGRFDELTDSVGNLVGVSLQAGGALISAFSPVGDIIRDNAIDPIIQLTNSLASDFGDFLNLDVDISGLDSVSAADAELRAIAESLGGLSPAARAVEADMEKLRQGIDNGTNDTRRARIELAALSKVFSEVTTAPIVDQLEKYNKSLQQDGQSSLEQDLDQVFSQLDRLSGVFESGASGAKEASTQYDLIVDSLEKIGETTASQGLAEVGDKLADLTDSQLDRTIDSITDKIKGLEAIELRTGGATELTDEIEALELVLRRLGRESVDREFLKFIEEGSKEAEKATERTQKALDGLVKGLRTPAEELQDVAGLINDALRDTEVDLSLDAAIGTFERQLDEFFKSELDSLQGELQQIAGRQNNTFGNLQVGSAEELNAILQLQESQTDADRIRSEIANLNRERNQKMDAQAKVFADIAKNTKGGGAGGATQITVIQRSGL